MSEGAVHSHIDSITCLCCTWWDVTSVYSVGDACAHSQHTLTWRSVPLPTWLCACVYVLTALVLKVHVQLLYTE